MTESSILIVGGGITGRTTARNLAARGLDVSLIDAEPAVPESLAAEVTELRALGVEVRSAVALVGVIDLGSHVEAELVDGRVENHDAVIVTDPDANSQVTTESPRVIRIDADGDPDRLSTALRDIGLML
ncbi:FAD-dependent oxidoreductase [Microbacterium gorillae]|uniref:FAD-dependent oxidoreductase n=1 Tax=Microbacterium gorillae TaxID=1231063 RepID=UPI00058C189A|nr:FAD-dependent oxidoreductase [Microbacterium gorillae]